MVKPIYCLLRCLKRFTSKQSSTCDATMSVGPEYGEGCCCSKVGLMRGAVVLESLIGMKETRAGADLIISYFAKGWQQDIWLVGFPQLEHNQIMITLEAKSIFR